LPGNISRIVVGDMMAKALTLAVAAATLAGGARAQYLNTTTNSTGYTNYTTITGYFLQDDASTNASAFDYVCRAVSGGLE